MLKTYGISPVMLMKISREKRAVIVTGRPFK